mgnify:CR=1 FL=1
MHWSIFHFLCQQAPRVDVLQHFQRLPEEDLGQFIPWRRISFGQEVVELGAEGNHPASYLGILSLKDYPGHTASGMFDDLLRLPFELTISQSFGFVDRQAALSRMNLALRRMRSAEDEAVSLRAELANAKDDVAAGRAGFGEHHLTIAIRGETPEQVDAGVAETQAALADLGAPYPIDAWLAITENRTSAEAYKPQDLVTAVDGHRNNHP